MQQSCHDLWSDSVIYALLLRARCEEPPFVSRDIKEEVDGSSLPTILEDLRQEEREIVKFGVKGGEYFERYGLYGIDSIWRDDLLPCPIYLRHCVLSAMALSDEAHDSFLDHTYLGDRKTTIREYLAARTDIMELVPPPELAERYNG